MRRRRRAQPSRPWTDAEDAKLREISEIGLSSCWWNLALPDRGIHEMLDRRMELGIKPARLI